ncbi:hypothetical protein AJ80_04780 [Polytolypa hystricis UAMH7299]|uniref:SMP-30/Gluconolactonase/LRE-like region domain-containing protein n=1 Tax=Polytolypa hystricis (strain UAMH7299) TaxID=1447883 RepID=A0A2B7Y8M9_POLH7|nr:hypothetical protein AJ80_04780 [Polytolypa hystricis UAMH7299]
MRIYNTKSLLSELTLAALIASVAASPLAARSDVPKVKGTAVDLNGFGPAIEGASVNEYGSIFAVDYRPQPVEDPDYTPNKFSFVSIAEGDPMEKSAPAVILPEKGPIKTTYLAGSRYIGDGEFLLADALNKRVLRVKPKTGCFSEFCSDPGMLQPNDIAIHPKNKNIIYLSGQNYTETTKAGESGDLWMCDGKKATQFSPEFLGKAGVHRTNGIEVAPDGSMLYLSSAKNEGGKVIENMIFKIPLDSDGKMVQAAPYPYYTFADDPENDVDGMRADIEGNLYVTRNPAGRVVKIARSSKMPVLTIEMPGVKGPSNLEFGGKDGKELYAVGRCEADEKKGCAAKYLNDIPGRAWSELQKEKKDDKKDNKKV